MKSTNLRPLTFLSSLKVLHAASFALILRRYAWQGRVRSNNSNDTRNSPILIAAFLPPIAQSLFSIVRQVIIRLSFSWKIYLNPTCKRVSKGEEKKKREKETFNWKWNDFSWLLNISFSSFVPDFFVGNFFSSVSLLNELPSCDHLSNAQSLVPKSKEFIKQRQKSKSLWAASVIGRRERVEGERRFNFN